MVHIFLIIALLYVGNTYTMTAKRDLTWNECQSDSESDYALSEPEAPTESELPDTQHSMGWAKALATYPLERLDELLKPEFVRGHPWVECDGMPVMLLDVALKYKRYDVVQLLLQKGADPAVAGPARMTALHCATLCRPVRETKKERELYRSTLEALFSAASDINVNGIPLKKPLPGSPALNESPSARSTPLMYAAQAGNEWLVQLLYKKGAQLLCKDNYGRTAFDIAKEAKHEKLAALLHTGTVRFQYAQLLAWWSKNLDDYTCTLGSLPKELVLIIAELAYGPYPKSGK